ncbi:hypothetical protein BRADI_2g61085v3 [Brachypodium distachyon]|uniref:Uncharacterized protein n=1 Tax=Brachypodium distachyon TaxID=15368 RepID=A0A2K2DH53_BRADI|nr:hypothetical protein BRADI_2g61085v3 [Brachypodium distachyon]
MASSTTSPCWSDLPLNLVGHIVGMLPSTSDRARCRAVCRPWHTAVRHYGPPARQLPWVVLSDGCIFTHSDGYWHQITSFPDGAVCVGSSDVWLALVCTTDDDDNKKQHTYLLHNPSSSAATVPLPDLDAALGSVPDWFLVRKVLLRSGRPDDLVAVTTNHSKYPFVLIRPGKGAWFADRDTTTNFERIVDVTFLGDTLYAVTWDEDLASLPITFDGDGVPVVTGIERVILRRPMDDYDFDAWSYGDEADHGDDDELPQVDNNEEGVDDKAEDDDDMLDKEGHDDQPSSQEDGGDEYDDVEDDELPREGIVYGDNDDGDGFFCIMRHLVESRGKLLMVIRQLQWPSSGPCYTGKVDVFEANLTTCTWEAVTGGLGGHAFFISKCFSMSVLAYGEEIKGDTMFFIDTGKLFNTRSQTSTKPRSAFRLESSTWVFNPELVV